MLHLEHHRAVSNGEWRSCSVDIYLLSKGVYTLPSFAYSWSSRLFYAGNNSHGCTNIVRPSSEPRNSKDFTNISHSITLLSSLSMGVYVTPSIFACSQPSTQVRISRNMSFILVHVHDFFACTVYIPTVFNSIGLTFPFLLFHSILIQRRMVSIQSGMRHVNLTSSILTWPC